MSQVYEQMKKATCVHCKAGLEIARGIFKLNSKPMHWSVMGQIAVACTAPTPDEFIERQAAYISKIIDEQKAEIDRMRMLLVANTNRNKELEDELKTTSAPLYTDRIANLEAENQKLSRWLAREKQVLDEEVERSKALEAENQRLTKQLAVTKLALAVAIEESTGLQRMVSGALRSLGGALI